MLSITEINLLQGNYNALSKQNANLQKECKELKRQLKIERVRNGHLTTKYHDQQQQCAERKGK